MDLAGYDFLHKRALEPVDGVCVQKDAALSIWFVKTQSDELFLDTKCLAVRHTGLLVDDSHHKLGVRVLDQLVILMVWNLLDEFIVRQLEFHIHFSDLDHLQALVRSLLFSRVSPGL